MAAPNKFKIGDYVKFQDKPGLRLQPYVYTVLADLAIKDKKTKETNSWHGDNDEPEVVEVGLGMEPVHLL